MSPAKEHDMEVRPQFDREYKPGEIPSHSGIYRCCGCGCDILAEPLKPFPRNNHPDHSPAQGTIRWRLCVAPQLVPH